MCYKFRTPLLPGQLKRSDLSVTSTLQSVNWWRHIEFSCCLHPSFSYRLPAQLLSRWDRWSDGLTWWGKVIQDVHNQHYHDCIASSHENNSDHSLFSIYVKKLLGNIKAWWKRRSYYKVKFTIGLQAPMAHSVLLWLDTQRYWVLIPAGANIFRRGCAYTLIKLLKGLECAVLSMALRTLQVFQK